MFVMWKSTADYESLIGQYETLAHAKMIAKDRESRGEKVYITDSNDKVVYKSKAK